MVTQLRINQLEVLLGQQIVLHDVDSHSSLALPNFIGIDSFSGFINRGAEVAMSQVRREFRQSLST